MIRVIILLKNFMRLFYCFIVLLIQPVFTNGQIMRYILNGNIHVKNGATYPYLLFFNIDGSKLSGYSVTKLPDGSEPRVVVEGQVEKDRRIMSLSEKKLVGDLPENRSMCLVESVLSYKSQNTRFPLSGGFMSKDDNNKYCGEGLLEFETSKFLDELFGIPAGETKTVIMEETYRPQTGELEITTGLARQFEWTSDTCIVEIYDGGIVDGDEVTVLLNDQSILTNYVLTKQKKQLVMPLPKKKNTLTIVAGFEGKVPPNTVNLMLTDGSKKYKVKAFNYAGDKATIIINRK
jgi:hypothetical protein